MQQLQKGDYPWVEVLAYKTGKSSQAPVTLSADGGLRPDTDAEAVENIEVEGAEDADAQARDLRSVDQAPQVAVRSTLKHAGATWTEAQCTQLVSDLRAGLLWPDIAARLERASSAVRTQAARMVPADAVAGGSKAQRVDWLREQLTTDTDYDWRTPLRANTDGALWLEDDDAQLRAGWQAGTALAQLARQFDCSEEQVVRRLVVLRLAAGVVDVVDRLGCTPGGAVETRYLLATDASSAHLQILIGSEKAGGAAMHVSVHTSTTAAAERAAKVDQMRARAGLTPLHWSSGERRVDLAHGEGELHPLG